MWIFVFFDLPSATPSASKKAAHFRRLLLKQGFLMFQYSVYIKHCLTTTDTHKWKKRIIQHIPPQGRVAILTIQDREYDNIAGFIEGEPSKQWMPEPDKIFMLL